MSNSNNSSSSGIGFFGLLFIVFLTLKLCNVIDWSWWWVSAPLWVPPTLILSIILWVFAGMGVLALFEGKKRYRR